MGRPPKIKKIVDAREWNAQGDQSAGTITGETPAGPALPVDSEPTTQAKKTRKKRKPVDLNSLLAEYQLKKEKLAKRYTEKINKAMLI